MSRNYKTPSAETRSYISQINSVEASEENDVILKDLGYAFGIAVTVRNKKRFKLRC